MKTAASSTHVRAFVLRYESWKASVIRRLKNRKVDTSRVPYRLYHEAFDEGLSPSKAAKEITEWTKIH
jgi:hypothetical protein